MRVTLLHGYGWALLCVGKYSQISHFQVIFSNNAVHNKLKLFPYFVTFITLAHLKGIYEVFKKKTQWVKDPKDNEDRKIN